MFRKISAIVVPTLIAVGIIAYMLYSVWNQLIIALRHMIPAYLFVGVAICLCAWWLRGWRYHTILKSLNYPVSVKVSTACIFVSQTVNLVVPDGWEILSGSLSSGTKYSTTYSEGVSSLVVERVFDVVTVAFLGAVSLFFVLNAPSWFTTFIIVPLAAGMIFFVFLLVIGKFSSRNKYIIIILTMLHEIKRASLTPRSLGLLGISSVGAWFLDILACVAVVNMFEQKIPFAVVVLAVVIGNLVKAVPLTPGVSVPMNTLCLLHSSLPVSPLPSRP